MNAYAAEQAAKASIIAALTAADCKDGTTLTASQVTAQTKTLFWFMQPSESGALKKSYITFEMAVPLSESEDYDRADNQVVAWDYEGSIDLFSNLALNDSTIITLLGAVVTQLELQGFNVSMGPDMYETNTKRWHKPISVSKNIL